MFNNLLESYIYKTMLFGIIFHFLLKTLVFRLTLKFLLLTRQDLL